MRGITTVPASAEVGAHTQNGCCARLNHRKGRGLLLLVLGVFIPPAAMGLAVRKHIAVGQDAAVAKLLGPPLSTCHPLHSLPSPLQVTFDLVTEFREMQKWDAMLLSLDVLDETVKAYPVTHTGTFISTYGVPGEQGGRMWV
jgi:hypothetical protein